MEKKIRIIMVSVLIVIVIMFLVFADRPRTGKITVPEETKGDVVEPVVDEMTDDALLEKLDYIESAEEYIDGCVGAEKTLNQLIFDVRENEELSNEEKVAIIAEAVANEGHIRYESGNNLFNWDNSFRDEDFLLSGCYYKDCMTYDCSGFAQYIVYIATGSSDHDGIIIGRGTYFSSIEGKGVNKPSLGTLCFRYNGGSGIERDGEEMLVGETATSKGNHVAIYIGDNKYVDCSESAGKVRVVDTTENPAYAEYFSWFRNVLDDPDYVSELEIAWHESQE